MKNDIVGLRFNYLLVLKESDRVGYNRYFLCKCDCGNEKNILLCNIISGRNSSCGCYLKSHKPKKDTCKVKLKACWVGMINRTTNKSIKQYKDWGGRGIKCEWTSFEEFYNDMKDSWREGLSLDRINNDGNYSKDNCRWATREEQQGNTRKNILVNGICIKQYCKLNNLNYGAINTRISLGWSIEKSINTPIRYQKNSKIYYKI